MYLKIYIYLIYIFDIYVKLFVVINKISAKLSSQNQFYNDFEPLSF